MLAHVLTYAEHDGLANLAADGPLGAIENPQNPDSMVREKLSPSPVDEELLDQFPSSA
jgi:hypothetical protein